MPKEVIYAEHLPYGDADPARSVIEISWSREASHVQMATKCVHAADHTAFVHPSFYEYLKPLSEDERLGVLSMMAGLYATLDRDGINSIIRVLRKARDQAFGRDE